jgi:NAD(P)-dependent dehydrogenase (short-subunit alcohol dehydrogenase family)
VTGGSDGLGKQSVLEFARHRPAQIWIAVRNLDKAKAAVEEIKQQVPDVSIKLLQLDLSPTLREASRNICAENLWEWTEEELPKF